MRSLNMALWTAALALSLTASAFGTITFTNLGPGDARSASAGGINTGNLRAKSFTATTTGALTSIRLPLGVGGTPNANLTISLRGPGANPNGVVLESWSVPPAGLPAFPASTMVTLTSLTNPHLTSGTTYWLRAESTTANTTAFDWFFNSTGDVTPAASGNDGVNWSITTSQVPALEVNVFTPPTVTKSFTIGTILLNANSTVSISVANPNAANLTGVNLTDQLPAGLVLAGVVIESGSCIGGSVTSGFPTNSASLVNTTIGANATCTLTFPVTGTQAGQFTNSTGPVTSNEASAAAAATAVLTVLGPPVVTKSFSVSSVPLNGTATMTIGLQNPNSGAMANVQVTDTMPAGISIIGGPTFSAGCPGGQTASAGSPITFNVPSLPANGICTATYTVQGTQLGAWTNTTGAPSGVINDLTLTGNPASATLAVAAPPTVTKVITADTLLVGGTTSMTLTLTNPNPFPLTGVALNDLFPAGLTPSNPGGTCTPTATVAGQTLSISGVTLAADPAVGHQCTITATVTGVTPGLWTNTTDAPTATGPAALTGVASNPDSVLVLAVPELTKAFNPATIAMSATSVITFTIKNSNPTAMTNVAFADTFPPGLIVNQAANVTNTCGGTFTAVSNAPAVSLTGGSIAANSSCTITVTVQATTPGTKVNTTSTVAGTVSGNALVGPAATATLNVNASEVSFLIRYASNLSFGESVVNFTNTGSSSTAGLPTGGQNGEICANVFAYSPDEQLVSCCSCNVTPNALNSLSVKADLGTNTLTPIIPSSLVIKVVATAGGAACTASSAATVNTAVLQPGLEAWGTTIHALPVTNGTPATTYGVTETAFAKAAISMAELDRMAGLCAFIRANGSGYGICKSCKVGGLGASVK